MRIALAQINTTVGDLPHNRRLVEETYARALEAGADLIVFPELTLNGYPPEDLLLKPSFLEDTRACLERLCPQIDRGLVIVGFADGGLGGLHNAAALICGGRLLAVYHKCTLPNYGVFDEQRYFQAGARCPVYAIGPWRIAVNICEDLWVPDGVPRVQARAGGANLMLNLSASPYHARKGRARAALVSDVARRFGLPVLQTNLIGGQDELVFDGQSLAADARGRLLARAPQFEPHLLLVDLPAPRDPAVDPRAPAAERAAAPAPDPDPPAVPAGLQLDLRSLPAAAGVLAGSPGAAPSFAPPASPGVSLGTPAPELGEEEEIYRALMLGLRDYALKNSFRGVVLGLSGGIDSALTATIAADALGHEAVVGISLPSPYSSASARAGARELAANLDIAFHEVPITAIFERTCRELRALLPAAPTDVTAENLQARIRGMILMAFSNRCGHLVLATGNKSEVAVGYCTLYGDMVGGYAVLKDVFKTQVYALARWRNASAPAAPPIPADTLSRAPSAELRPDQRDDDTLPPYEILDPIVKALVEDDRHPRDVVAQGYDRATVDAVFGLIQGNEYKRRQAAPGIKITPRAFGRDRRYPLTNRYRPKSC